MITADPLGKARRADLSVDQTCTAYSFAELRTGFGVTGVAFWEASERQVEALVHVANVLLEVRLNLGELDISFSLACGSFQLTLPPLVPAMTMLRVSLHGHPQGASSLGNLASSTQVEHGHTHDTDLQDQPLHAEKLPCLTFLSDLDWPEGVIPVVYSPWMLALTTRSRRS
jgi:hypothetical protein